MAKNTQYTCPKCGGLLEIWVDITAGLYFQVSATGKLSKKDIRSHHQTDGQYGVDCTSCDWSSTGGEVESEGLAGLLDVVLGKAHNMEL